MKRYRISSPTSIVLICCGHDLITYLDRVNVSTAAAGFGKEFHYHTGSWPCFFRLRLSLPAVSGNRGWSAIDSAPSVRFCFAERCGQPQDFLTGFAGGLASLPRTRYCSASAKARRFQQRPVRCPLVAKERLDLRGITQGAVVSAML